MEIIIKAIYDKTPDGYRIEFQTEVGSAQGLWVDKESPRLNEPYQVEFATSEDLRFGHNVLVNDASKSLIQTVGSYTQILGEVGIIYPNSLSVILKLGNESVMLPIEGNIRMDEGMNI